jgi:hypothetical protein
LTADETTSEVETKTKPTVTGEADEGELQAVCTLQCSLSAARPSAVCEVVTHSRATAHAAQHYRAQISEVYHRQIRHHHHHHIPTSRHSPQSSRCSSLI